MHSARLEAWVQLACMEQYRPRRSLMRVVCIETTAVTQGLSVATESGMASTQINVATGVSGYNPSAANPGSSAQNIQ